MWIEIPDFTIDDAYVVQDSAEEKRLGNNRVLLHELKDILEFVS